MSSEDQEECGSDESLSFACFEVEEREDGWVYVKLPSVEELDEVLGAERWRIGDGDDMREKMGRMRRRRDGKGCS